MTMQPGLTFDEVAHAVAVHTLEDEVPRLREVAREAARGAPIKVALDPVDHAVLDAVHAIPLLLDRVVVGIKAELGEYAARAAEEQRGGHMFRGDIDAAITRAASRLADEAVAERGREIAKQLGVTVPEDHDWRYGP